MKCIEIFSNKLRGLGENKKSPENRSNLISKGELLEKIFDYGTKADVYLKKFYVNESSSCKIIEEKKPIICSFAEGTKIIFVTEKEMMVFSKFKKNNDGSRLSSGIRYVVSENDNNILFEPITICLMKNNSILINSRENLKKCKNQNVFMETYKKLNEGKLRSVSLLC
jgi:hypothetical protein